MTWPNASWPNASWPDIFWPNASWPSDVGSTAYITVNDITVAEDAGIATFTVTRSGDTSGVSSVNYATTQYTAFAGQDYVATSGTLTFTTGQTSKTVSITVNNTTNYELNELFYLDLTNPVNATISKARGICTLTDVSGFPSATSVTSPTVSEGNNITFRVTFPRLAEFSVPHTYVLGGTATAGIDYNFTPVSILNNIGTSASSISATSGGGSFTCPVNTYWVDITFALLTDISAESAETLILTVDGTASGTGTITDVPPPTISTVSSPSAEEGTNLVFTVTRTGTGGATINYAYSLGGTASAPSDYTATPTLSNGVTISGGDFVVPAAVTSFTATFSTAVNGDNGETVVLTVGGVSGTGTISAIGSTPIGDSLSTFAQTSLVVENTSTTDTLNVNDGAANGYITIAPPVSGTFTKTIHKTGTATSKIFSRSRLGYVRLTANSTGPKIRIGSADLTLPQRHCLMVLMRIDPDVTLGALGSGYTGELNVCEVTQTDGTNKYLRITIPGGNFSPTATRRIPKVIRSAIVSSAPSTLEEYSGSSNAWGITPNMFRDNAPATPGWVWLVTVGKDTSDASASEQTLVFNGSSPTYQGTNNQAFLMAQNGIHPSAHMLHYRKVNSPTFDTGAGSYINPQSLGASFGNQNIDFTLGGTSDGTAKTIDIARVVKLNSFPGLDKIAAICAGHHPETVIGGLTGDEFCKDFGSLPAGCTELNGAPVYNPAEDGPIASVFHGTDASDVVLNIVNQRVS